MTKAMEEARAIVRYDLGYSEHFSGLVTSTNGAYMRFADHATALAARDAEIERLRERVSEMDTALEAISMMHDGNPPLPLADMPDLDYARRTLQSMRIEARRARTVGGQHG